MPPLDGTTFDRFNVVSMFRYSTQVQRNWEENKEMSFDVSIMKQGS